LLIASLAELTRMHKTSLIIIIIIILSASQHESQASWMMGFCEEDTKHTYIPSCTKL
jgi:hypothetical protein